MSIQIKKNDKRKMILLFIVFNSVFSISMLFGQNIPIASNTLTVYPASYTNALHVLHKLGYRSASEDKTSQQVRTDFKLYPGTICHISIQVLIKNDSAQISGLYWTDTAPISDGNSNNLKVVRHVDGQMDVLFDELLKYAKALGGSSIRYSTTVQNK
jgi:hypothetical protein